MIIPICPQNAVRVALRVIELPRPKGPEEGCKPDPAQNKRHRNENGQHFQDRTYF